jgi:hypothetical protein
MSDQNCPYDVAVDLGRLIRIQVKATRKPREIPGRKTPLQAYLFRLGRSRPAGTKAYAEGEFEMLALVALDARLIAYFPANLHVGSLCIGQPGARTGKKFADYPFAKTAAELGLAAQEGV